MKYARRTALLFTLTVTFAVSIAGSASAALTIPYLPWTTLLPPIGVPYYPSTSPHCPAGELQCADDTIAAMTARLDSLAADCRHESIFQLMYLRVSQELRGALTTGVFRDNAWTVHEMASFAATYFETFDAWEGGNRAVVPQAWKVALDAARDHRVSALGNFVLSMNAHVNRDMPFVLASIGMTTPAGKSRKPDHDAFNARLATLYNPVLSEIAGRFDPTADDLDIGPLDDFGGQTLLQTWREGVWRNAERLVLARTPAARARVAASIEVYANSQAAIYYELFKYRTASARDKRDQFCAAQL